MHFVLVDPLCVCVVCAKPEMFQINTLMSQPISASVEPSEMERERESQPTTYTFLSYVILCWVHEVVPSAS